MIMNADRAREISYSFMDDIDTEVYTACLISIGKKISSSSHAGHTYIYYDITILKPCVIKKLENALDVLGYETSNHNTMSTKYLNIQWGNDNEGK